jgi:PKD domain
MTHYPETREKSGRRSRRWLAVTAAAVAVAGSALTAATVTAAAASATTTATTSHPGWIVSPNPPISPKAGTVLFAVGKRACAQPARKGTASCDAEIRVLVPLSRAATEGAQRFVVGDGAKGKGTIGPAGGLTPDDLGTAYGLNTSGGAGQTVGIVDAYNDPNIAADLQTFDTEYGLPACTEGNGCLRVVNEAGDATPLPADDESGWSVEESLDVEAVHSVCHSCHILLVEASTNGNGDLGASENTAVRLGANEVSNSFGEPEAGSDSSYQADFNHPGTVITASAGDDGYYFFDQLDGTDQPSIPASFNTTVSVGGTSLYLNQGGGRQSESVWNDNGPKDYYQRLLDESFGAAGGGCSTQYTAREWQKSLAGWDSTGCGNMRLDNDVAADADYLTGFDIYDSYACDQGCDTGWLTIGGTSLSSPIIASAFALAGGGHGVSYPALTLYGHKSQAYDVTTGGNGWCDGAGAAQCGDQNLGDIGDVDCDYTAAGAVNAGDRACDALSGYDGPTGVGTPDGSAMFNKTGPAVDITGPVKTDKGDSVTFTAKVVDPFPGGVAVRYVWNWGDGTTDTTTFTGHASASHTYKTTGIHKITVTVTDNYGATGTATHDVTVEK